VSEDAASFVGIERVKGSVCGRSGTFLLQDQGTLKGTTVFGEGFVVPGSGTGSPACAVEAASPPNSVSATTVLRYRGLSKNARPTAS
jgi:hypothetical protein